MPLRFLTELSIISNNVLTLHKRSDMQDWLELKNSKFISYVARESDLNVHRIFLLLFSALSAVSNVIYFSIFTVIEL